LEVAVSPDPKPARPFAPLRHGTFRAIWVANLISNFGGMIQAVGAAWLMTSLTSSAAPVALVQASLTLPLMLFSLAAGAIADNYDKRAVMLAAQCFMISTSALLAVCAYAGLIAPWSLLAFTFLIGCGMALNNPAWQSSVRDMVPRQDLPQAIALNSVGMNIARSVGPALGGTIVAAAGAAAAFAVNAFSYVAIIFVLLGWKPPHQERVLPPEPLGSAMRAGLRFVSMSPAIRAVLFRAGVFGFAGGALQALMPLIARDLVGGGPITFGLLLGAFGVGAIGGGLSSARVRYRLGTERLVRLSFLGFAATALVAAYSVWTPVTMLATALGGACWVLALSSFNIAVQVSSPRWVVGRTLALYQTAAFGGMAVGSWNWGLLTELFGIREALAISAAIHVLGVLIGLRWPLPDNEDTNLEPLNRWKEPSLGLEILPRSGPIVVTIEYRIRAEDTREFLALMAERRRIRRRDGARHWHLLRDLGDPDFWIERYDTPTWLDYVRISQRITHADARIVDRLRELHQGGEPPRVRRRIERQPIAAPGMGFANNAEEEPPTDPTQAPG
jgi:MFS family permease